jgi:hypothetical protein
VKQAEKKLAAYGIAPPNPKQIVCNTRLFAESEAVQCPLCNSYHTELISRFGSTPCKAYTSARIAKNPSIILNVINFINVTVSKPGSIILYNHIMPSILLEIKDSVAIITLTVLKSLTLSTVKWHCCFKNIG